MLKNEKAILIILTLSAVIIVCKLIVIKLEGVKQDHNFYPISNL